MQKNKKGIILHNVENNIVESSKQKCLWITRHVVNKTLTNFKRDTKFNAIVVS